MTELVFILDRSGSMSGLEKDTIGGFNSMLEKQRKEPGAAYISTVLFDHKTKVVHDRLPIDQVPQLTEEDYYVGGSTALLDAVGKAIKHVSNIHKYARQEDVPQKTLFVITTDGMENSSQLYSYKQVRQMIEEQQKEHGWEFIFLGANIDAAAEAGRLGIAASRACNFVCDQGGIQSNFFAINKLCCMVRNDAPISEDWKKDIEENYASRSQKSSKPKGSQKSSKKSFLDIF